MRSLDSNEREFSSNSSIVDLFMDAARRFPEREAVVGDGGTVLTYEQLNDLSNQYANHLRSIHSTADNFVCFLGPRCVESIVGLLGILKSGAAYVPLDPNWPYARIAGILSQIGTDRIMHTRASKDLAFGFVGNQHPVKHLVEVSLSQHQTERILKVDYDQIELWDEISSHDDLHKASGFNFSKSGSILPDHQIEKYRDHILELVGPVSMGQKILEIGCGAGLILRSLAKLSGSCVGVDPSRVAISRLMKWSEDQNISMTTHCCFAHEIGQIEDTVFDAIIISSVTQFFPNLDYLFTVIEIAGKLLSPEGRLILADIVPPGNSDIPGLTSVPESFINYVVFTQKNWREA